MPVLTIQIFKGQVVFFRTDQEKISTLKPLTVWIFAIAISPTKTYQDFTILPHFSFPSLLCSIKRAENAIKLTLSALINE